MADNGALADYQRPSRPSRTSVHILDERRGSQQYQPPRASTTQPPHLNSVLERAQRPSQTLQNVNLQQRRQSIWMRRPSDASGIRKSGTMHGSSDIASMKNIAYENTYQLEPRKEQAFFPSKVEPVIEEILENFLDSETYEASKCAALVLRISDVIKGRMKALGFARHKIVAIVTIGQKGGQSLRCASRCLWDRDFDGFASASYSNNSLFATATVYAVYFD